MLGHIKDVFHEILFHYLFCLCAAFSNGQRTRGRRNRSPVATAQPAAQKLTVGKVRKVDLEQGDLTIMHEALENLEMPGLTMVFKATDGNFLKGVKQGDKILFRAAKGDAGFMVVRLEPQKKPERGRHFGTYL